MDLEMVLVISLSRKLAYILGLKFVIGYLKGKKEKEREREIKLRMSVIYLSRLLISLPPSLSLSLSC